MNYGGDNTHVESYHMCLGCFSNATHTEGSVSVAMFLNFLFKKGLNSTPQDMFLVIRASSTCL